jgi:RNA polymerase sigma-70 factor (ECF subfamily)
MKSQVTDLNELMRLVVVFKSESAYKALFKSLYPSLRAFSFTLLKSDELAEEIAGDVMIKIWQTRHTLLEVRNIKVYAMIMVRNAALNLIKHRAKKDTVSLDEIDVQVFVDTHSPEQILITAELKKRLDEVIRCLPNKCKLVFKLVKEDGLSYKETAEILNISPKTVDAHLVTAVRKIASVLRVEFNLTR